MKLADLAKARGSRVIGMDCSSNSLAFAIFDDKEPVVCGEFEFTGASIFERLCDAKIKTRALVDLGIFQADYIGIESAVMVRNVQTAIDLAYVYGAVIGELMEGSPVVEKVAPISWQSGIGNPNLKTYEKAEIKKQYPGKSESWYKNTGRLLRKQRTLDIAKRYFTIEDNSDNVGDAVGIALFLSETRVLTPTGR